MANIISFLLYIITCNQVLHSLSLHNPSVINPIPDGNATDSEDEVFFISSLDTSGLDEILAHILRLTAGSIVPFVTRYIVYSDLLFLPGSEE